MDNVIESAADFLLNTFGITGEPPATDPPTPPATDPPPVVTDPVPPVVTDPVPPVVTDPEGTPAPEPDKPVDVSKAEAAFAAMRVENKTYKQTMDSMARLLGLEEKDPVKLFEAVQAQVLAAQAKKDNVPVEILARLDASDADRAAREAEARRTATNEGFAEVAKEFKLTQTEMQDFATSLRDMGINPYEMDIDLPSMYKLQNFDAILEKARIEGETREAERLAKVNAHASNPNSSTGKPPAPGTTVNTVKGLDDFFSKL